MKHTLYAKRLLQRQGIRSTTLKLVCEYGRVLDQRGGVCRIVFDSDSKRELIGEFGKAVSQLKFNTYAVVDASRPDVVVGAGHSARCTLYSHTGAA